MTAGHDDPPLRMCRYLPADWPGPDPLSQWADAARAWLAGHPGTTALPLARTAKDVDDWEAALRTSYAERNQHGEGVTA